MIRAAFPGLAVRSWSRFCASSSAHSSSPGPIAHVYSEGATIPAPSFELVIRSRCREGEEKYEQTVVTVFVTKPSTATFETDVLLT